MGSTLPPPQQQHNSINLPPQNHHPSPQNLKRKRDETDMPVEFHTSQSTKRQNTGQFAMESDLVRAQQQHHEYINPSSTQESTPPSSLLQNARSRAYFSELKKTKKKDESRFTWLHPKFRKDAQMRRPDDKDYDSSTLHIPTQDMKKLTSMVRQYWEIKKDKMDTILLFKKGKFYEMYEEDADIAHREFDLKISPRINMRMAGVPESSKETWINRFLQRGYKIAVVEQVETRNAANKRKKADIVKRSLTEVISPGTVVDSEMLGNDEEAKYLLVVKEDAHQRAYGVIFADLSRAEINVGYLRDDAHRTLFETLMHQINPVEILVEKNKVSEKTASILKNLNPPPALERLNPLLFDAQGTKQSIEIDDMFGSNGSSAGDSMEHWPQVMCEYADNDTVMAAFGAFVHYLKEHMKLEETVQLKNFKKYDPEQNVRDMILYGETLINLEILKNRVDGSTRGTLLEHISHCVTPFGKRQFRKWILHPLRKVSAIEDRLNAIEDLDTLTWDSDDLKVLKGIPDIERHLRTIHAFSISEHSVVTFDEKMDKKRSKMFSDTLSGLEKLAKLAKELENRRGSDKLTSHMIQRISTMSDLDGDAPVLDDDSFPNIFALLDRFRRSFDERMYSDSGILYPKEGGGYARYDEACEKLRELGEEKEGLLKNYQKYFKSKDVVLNKPRSGTLKFLVEVPKIVQKRIGSVPSSFKAEKSTKKVNRFHDQSLDQLVDKIITAEEDKDRIVTQFLRDTFKEFASHYAVWNRCVALMSTLDCLHSLWKTSKFPSHCRPEFIPATVENAEFDVRGLFHPCVNLDSGREYISNNVHLGGSVPKSVILTGPNMSGKSSISRCVCIAAIMAQIGCYVPASRFRLTPIDSIFTRIGANDRICAGESTFMVELLETSNIIKHATSHSLVILDELGRGTSTIDGYSIAFAVAKHLAEEKRCLTLFSTHYHSLTDEVKNNPLYALYFMDSLVKEVDGIPHVDFLYKMREGVCSDSYGLNVARMAHIPDQVLNTAKSITHELKLENLQEKMFALYEEIRASAENVNKLKELHQKAKELMLYGE